MSVQTHTVAIGDFERVRAARYGVQGLKAAYMNDELDVEEFEHLVALALEMGCEGGPRSVSLALNDVVRAELGVGEWE